MHEVEAAAGEREPQVRADADGNAHLRPPRDRHRRPDRDHVARRRVPLHDAAAGEQLAGARRGGEHGHLVAVGTKARRDARDVLVHVMWLRPRERGHEADAHCDAA